MKVEIKIKENGSNHGCDSCIHRTYCDGTKRSLINHAQKIERQANVMVDVMLDGTRIRTIYIPSNCPTKSEKFVFR